jgi:hypothetical protein
MAEIIISIDGTGSAPVIDVKGAKGKQCLALTKPFEDALGGTKIEVKSKPEMLEVATGGKETLKASL